MTKPVTPPVDPPHDEAEFVAAVAAGVAQADAGLSTPFEAVADWLATWGSEKEAASPR